MSGRRPLPRPVRVRLWEGIRAGLAVEEAGRAAGVSPETARRWFGQAGGVIGNGPGPVFGRYLSLAEREEIAVGRAGIHRNTTFYAKRHRGARARRESGARDGCRQS